MLLSFSASSPQTSHDPQHPHRSASLLPPPPPESPAVVPLILASCVSFLFLLLVIRWWWSSPVPVVTPSTPTQCDHWISLQGSFHQPQILCWPPTPGSSHPNLSLWHTRVRLAQPRCKLPDSVPLPTHGQQLNLSQPPDSHSFCQIHITWMPGQTRISLGIPLQLNHDNLEDLAALPGLSLRVVRRIIDHRHAHGPFTSLEQLRQIKGIGPKTLTKLKHYLSLSGKKFPVRRP